MLLILGQKSNKLPIGRATAQPRVNVADGVYSPYSSVRVAKNNGTTKEPVNNAFDNSKSKNAKLNSEQQTLKVNFINKSCFTLKLGSYFGRRY